MADYLSKLVSVAEWIEVNQMGALERIGRAH